MEHETERHPTYLIIYMININPDIISIFKSFSNTIYDLVFVFELNTNLVLYASDQNILDMIPKRNDNDSLNFSQVLESISGEDIYTIENLLKIINDYCKEHITESTENIIFISDLGYNLNKYTKSSASYKFIPIKIEKEANYMLCCVGLSAGIYKKKILAADRLFKNKIICDISNGIWTKYETQNLNTNEMVVLALSAEGYSVKEISKILHKAPDTVKSIRKNIFYKFGVSNIQKAITYAIIHRINTTTCTGLPLQLSAGTPSEDETD